MEPLALEIMLRPPTLSHAGPQAAHLPDRLWPHSTFREAWTGFACGLEPFGTISKYNDQSRKAPLVAAVTLRCYGAFFGTERAWIIQPHRLNGDQDRKSLITKLSEWRRVN